MPNINVYDKRGGYFYVGGYSYVEILVAMAILMIILLPVLPALSQAQANHRHAVLRHQAQGQASAIALEIRNMPNNASHIVQRAALNNAEFVYRVSLVPTGAGSRRQYTAGDVTILPPATPASFQTSYGNLFADGMFVVSEVFDSNGNLAGFYVGKIN